MSKYLDTFNKSITDKENFWREVAKDVIWYEPFDEVLHTDGPPFYQWFKGGKINTCYNALDRHVDEGNGDRLALIYDSPITGNKKHLHLFSNARSSSGDCWSFKKSRCR